MRKNRPWPRKAPSTATSMVRKLVKQFAAKRNALKATAENESLSLEERFEARLKLAEAAAQLRAEPHPQPLRGDRAVRAPSIAS